jgi:hypothetical protein
VRPKWRDVYTSPPLIDSVEIVGQCSGKDLNAVPVAGFAWIVGRVRIELNLDALRPERDGR